MRRAGVILAILGVIVGVTSSAKSQVVTDVILLKISWSPNGEYIAGVGSNLLRVWDAATGEIFIDFPIATHVPDVSWSPDSTKIVTVSDDQFMRVWNIAHLDYLFGEILAEFQPFPKGLTIVTSVDWSPDGNLIATGAVMSSLTMRTWDANTYKQINQLSFGWVEQIEWHPDPLRHEIAYAGGSFGDGATILSAVTPPSGKISTLGDRYVTTRAIAWNSDGSQIAVGYEDATIFVWDVATNEKIAMMSSGFQNSIYQLTWSPDDNYIASANGRVEIWNSITGERMSTLPGISLSVAWSPDGTRIAYRKLFDNIQIIDVPDVIATTESTQEAEPTP